MATIYLSNYTALLIAQYSEGEANVLESDIIKPITIQSSTTTTQQVGVIPDIHGGSSTTATTIQPNSTTFGNINSDTDIDYLKFITTGAGKITINHFSTTDITIALYDSSMTVITTASGTTINETVYKPAGTYYISITGSTNVTSGEYNIETTFTPITSLASPIILGGASISGTKSSVTDDIWFVVSNPSMYALNPTVNIIDTMIFTVYDENLNELTPRASDGYYAVSSSTTYFSIKDGIGTYSIAIGYANSTSTSTTTTSPTLVTQSPIRTNLVMEYSPSKISSLTYDSTTMLVSKIKNNADWDTTGVYDLVTATNSAPPRLSSATSTEAKYLTFSGLQALQNSTVYSKSSNTTSASGTNTIAVQGFADTTGKKSTIYIVTEAQQGVSQTFGWAPYTDTAETTVDNSKRVCMYLPYSSGDAFAYFGYPDHSATKAYSTSLLNKKILWKFEVSDGHWKLFKDGNSTPEFDFSSTHDVSNYNKGRLVFGKAVDLSANTGAHVELYDFLWYNDVTSASDDTSITSYLKTKHGIS